MENRIRRILLEEGARDYAMTRRILARLKGVPVEVIQDREALKTSGRDRAVWLSHAKTTLLLAVQKGPFWRSCPGTRDYICCGYQVLQVRAVGRESETHPAFRIIPSPDIERYPLAPI